MKQVPLATTQIDSQFAEFDSQLVEAEKSTVIIEADINKQQTPVHEVCKDQDITENSGPS